MKPLVVGIVSRGGGAFWFIGSLVNLVKFLIGEGENGEIARGHVLFTCSGNWLILVWN